MNALYAAALRFPTIVFTILLALLACYWLLVLLRIAPLELFERDSLRDEHMSSTLVSLGFAGVPATLALTFLMVIAAGLSLLTELYVLSWFELGMLRVTVGMLILWASLALASPLAGLLCRGLQRSLHRYRPFQRRCLLGSVVVVKDAQDSEYATARMVNEPDSAVTLHAKGDDLPQQGERRVLVKYLADEDAFRSVAEQTYLDARVRLTRLGLHHKEANSSSYS